MTDTPPADTTEEPFDEYTDDDDPDPTGPDGYDDPDPTEGNTQALEYAELVGVGALLLLGAVAAVGFYTSVSTAISRLVARQYEPLFQAAFNLVVLLIAGVGLSLLFRRRYS